MGSQRETGFLHVIAQKTGRGIKGKGGRQNELYRKSVLDTERHILKNGRRISSPRIYSKKSTLRFLESVCTEKRGHFFQQVLKGFQDV